MRTRNQRAHEQAPRVKRGLAQLLGGGSHIWDRVRVQQLIGLVLKLRAILVQDTRNAAAADLAKGLLQRGPRLVTEVTFDGAQQRCEYLRLGSKGSLEHGPPELFLVGFADGERNPCQAALVCY